MNVYKKVELPVYTGNDKKYYKQLMEYIVLKDISNYRSYSIKVGRAFYQKIYTYSVGQYELDIELDSTSDKNLYTCPERVVIKRGDELVHVFACMPFTMAYSLAVAVVKREKDHIDTKKKDIIAKNSEEFIMGELNWANNILKQGQ